MPASKLPNKKIAYSDCELMLTGKQLVVLKKLTELKTLVDADTLWILLKNSGVTIGRATVYRTLNWLYEQKQIVRLKPVDGGAYQYQKANNGAVSVMISNAE